MAWNLFQDFKVTNNSEYSQDFWNETNYESLVHLYEA